MFWVYYSNILGEIIRVQDDTNSVVIYAYNRISTAVKRNSGGDTETLYSGGDITANTWSFIALTAASASTMNLLSLREGGQYEFTDPYPWFSPKSVQISGEEFSVLFADLPLNAAVNSLMLELSFKDYKLPGQNSPKVLPMCLN
jgi:hypothetical protein